MPLIKHSPEFLEKQKRRAIALKAIESERAKKVKELKYQRLIDREIEIRSILKELDLANLEDQEKWVNLQAQVAKEGIPLIKFFSVYQYELITRMIRAVRLHNDICTYCFPESKGGFMNLEVFRETEDMLEICRSNISHLNQFQELGLIDYQEKWEPRRAKKSITSKSQSLFEKQAPKEFEDKVNSFVEDFFDTRITNKDKD